VLALDQFGDGVNFISRECHDRGTPRLPRDLAVAGEFKLREPRPGDDAGAGQQSLDDRAHGGSTQQQRFVAAAPMQDAVGEDMPAFQIGGDLDFIDRENRAFGGFIFSSPVMSATASTPARSTILL